MKLLLLSLSLLSTNVYAYQYNCIGIDRANSSLGDIEFGFTVKNNLIEIAHPIEKDNEEFSFIETKDQQALYGNYDWDGYGGSLFVRIPQSVLEGTVSSTSSFTLYYSNTNYSELGFLDEIDIKATCTL